VLATPAAPNFEPPSPQVADRRARDRRGTVGSSGMDHPRDAVTGRLTTSGLPCAAHRPGARRTRRRGRGQPTVAGVRRAQSPVGALRRSPRPTRFFVRLGEEASLFPCVRTYEELRGSRVAPGWPSNHLSHHGTVHLPQFIRPSFSRRSRLADFPIRAACGGTSTLVPPVALRAGRRAKSDLVHSGPARNRLMFNHAEVTIRSRPLAVWEDARPT